MTLERQGGDTVDLNSASAWHFEDQTVRPILDNGGIQAMPGDTLKTTCVFNSMSRSKTTYFNLATTDEMCVNNILTIAPTESARPVAFRCEGDMWMGELEADEDGSLVKPETPRISRKSTNLYSEN